MIHVESRVESTPSATGRIQQAATTALEVASSSGDLTVVLADDAQLRELHRDYLGVDATTDVLSFPADEADPETGARYLGDVIISVPQAESQAHLAGNSLEAELQLLVIHGVLHLLGHDHAEPGAKAAMWKLQAKALGEIGLKDVVIRE